jgi:hypothetical protein
MQKEHKSHVTQGTEFPFPTRLLNIRNSVICLVDGNDLKLSDRGYAPLSYCWGSTMPESSQTTSETLGAQREGMDFASLPKTLRRQ